MTRRHRHRQTRADLLWLAIGFVALQVGLAVASRAWLPELHDPSYAYKAARLRARLATADRPTTVVMLGSSRTAFGLRGMMLEDRLAPSLGHPVVAYNFGVYGAGPVRELIALRRLLADGIRPDLLLVEVTPPFLACQPGALAELASLPPPRLWWSEMPALEHYAGRSLAARRAWWQANVVPWYGYRFAVVSRLVPRWLPFQLQENYGDGLDAAGWAALPTPRPTPEVYRHNLEGAWRQFGGSLTGFRLGGPSCTGLRDLLELCRTERLSVALVLMPESSDFRGWYTPAASAEIQGFLADLSQELAAPVIDAREWVKDADFSDGHHLLADGATAFTERLSPQVLRLLTVADRSWAARH